MIVVSILCSSRIELLHLRPTSIKAEQGFFLGSISFLGSEGSFTQGSWNEDGNKAAGLSWHHWKIVPYWELRVKAGRHGKGMMEAFGEGPVDMENIQKGLVENHSAVER